MIEAPLNSRERNSSGWTSGLRPRRQCQTKAARSTAAPTRIQSIRGEAQPQSDPLTSPKVRSATPEVASTTPSGSGLWMGCPGTSGSRRQPTARAAIPTGRFTRNTHRQLAATNSPPTTGPIAAARPPIAVQARTAPWRRSGS